MLADLFRNGVFEDRANQLQHTVGRFDVAGPINSLQTSLICTRLMPLTPSEPTHGKTCCSPRVTRAVTLSPALLREPFERDSFERLKLRDASLVFFLLPLSAGRCRRRVVAAPGLASRERVSKILRGRRRATDSSLPCRACRQRERRSDTCSATIVAGYPKSLDAGQVGRRPESSS